MLAWVIVYSLTFSRIPLALAFIVFFQPSERSLLVALAILLIGLITDVLDGYLARKLSIATLSGLHWDSLSDKSIYIAATVAMNSQGLVSPLVCWIVIFRDVSMYVYRLVHADKIENLPKTKLYSRIHGCLMYVFITSGFANMLGVIHYGAAHSIAVTNSLGLISVIFGAYSAIAFSFKDKQKVPS